MEMPTIHFLCWECGEAQESKTEPTDGVALYELQCKCCKTLNEVDMESKAYDHLGSEDQPAYGNERYGYPPQDVITGEFLEFLQGKEFIDFLDRACEAARGLIHMMKIRQKHLRGMGLCSCQMPTWTITEKNKCARCGKVLPVNKRE